MCELRNNGKFLPREKRKNNRHWQRQLIKFPFKTSEYYYLFSNEKNAFLH